MGQVKIAAVHLSLSKSSLPNMSFSWGHGHLNLIAGGSEFIHSNAASPHTTRNIPRSEAVRCASRRLAGGTPLRLSASSSCMTRTTPGDPEFAVLGRAVVIQCQIFCQIRTEKGESTKYKAIMDLPGGKRKDNQESKGFKKRKHGNHAINGIDKMDSILEKRKELPVYKARSEILFECRRHSTLILVGDTGSGKTTQVPQFLFEAGYAKRGMIAITQPRRVAATSVARRVADEFGCRVGEEVGYTVLYKVVIMSATLEAETYARFFLDCKIVRVPGRMYPVEVLYTPEPQPDFLDAAVRMLPRYCKRDQGPYHLHGHLDIEGKTFLLTMRPSDKLIPCPLYAALPPSEQVDVNLETIQRICGANQLHPFADASVCSCSSRDQEGVPSSPQLSSSSMNGRLFLQPILLRAVDNGLVKARIYDPKNDMESLHEEVHSYLGISLLKVFPQIPISKAQAKQRAGRAGRVSSGKAFRLYTEEQVSHGMLTISTTDNYI
eukprot:766883-Hanusia_phi.AAC.6